MIEIRGVCKSYDGTPVLSDVDLTVPGGGVTAVVGPNGAGKSTLLSIAGRLLVPDRGTVRVDGLDVGATAPDVLARRLSILRQDHGVPVRLTVRELVSFGRFPHRDVSTRAEDDEHIERALHLLGLTKLASRRLDQLSGGQRQRAFIATVLCQGTDYVLLDEPLNSLDLRHSMESMGVIRSLADEHAKTIIIVLHDVNVAAGYADRIVAMRDGRVVAEGPPASIVSPAVLADVFGVEVAVREFDGRPIAMHFVPPVTRYACPPDLMENR